MMSHTGGSLRSVAAGGGAVAAGITVVRPGGAESLARPGNQVPRGPCEAAPALLIAWNQAVGVVGSIAEAVGVPLGRKRAVRQVRGMA